MLALRSRMLALLQYGLAAYEFYAARLLAMRQYAGTALQYAGTTPTCWQMGGIRILCCQVAGAAPVCWQCAPVCWHCSTMVTDWRHTNFMAPECWHFSHMLALRSRMMALLQYADRLAASKFYAVSLLALLPYAGTALHHAGPAPICWQIVGIRILCRHPSNPAQASHHCNILAPHHPSTAIPPHPSTLPPPHPSPPATPHPNASAPQHPRTCTAAQSFKDYKVRPSLIIQLC